MSGDLIVPWARTLFAVLFIYSLAARVRDRLLSVGQVPVIEPAMITIGFIALGFSQYFPEPLWLLSMFIGVALVPVQSEMARINEVLGAQPGPEADFSTINIVGLAIGTLFWLLVLITMFVPEVG